MAFQAKEHAAAKMTADLDIPLWLAGGKIQPYLRVDLGLTK
jgi:hypothetical protein